MLKLAFLPVYVQKIEKVKGVLFFDLLRVMAYFDLVSDSW